MLQQQWIVSRLSQLEQRLAGRSGHLADMLQQLLVISLPRPEKQRFP